MDRQMRSHLVRSLEESKPKIKWAIDFFKQQSSMTYKDELERIDALQRSEEPEYIEYGNKDNDLASAASFHRCRSQI